MRRLLAIGLIATGVAGACRSDPAVSPPAQAAALQADRSAADSFEALRGKPIRVQFRRDVLGLSAVAPLAPTAERVGARPVYLEGTLWAADDQWIALADEQTIYWIPRANILMIQTPR